MFQFLASTHEQVWHMHAPGVEAAPKSGVLCVGAAADDAAPNENVCKEQEAISLIISSDFRAGAPVQERKGPEYKAQQSTAGWVRLRMLTAIPRWVLHLVYVSQR